MANSPDWQAFQGKIQRGKSVELAANEAGIDLAEANAWLEESRKQKPYDDDTLRIAAAEALSLAMDSLAHTVKIHEGRVGTITEQAGEHSTTTKFDHPDVASAAALLKFALEAKKLLRPKERAPDAPAKKDLFDRPSNWQFKDSD